MGHKTVDALHEALAQDMVKLYTEGFTALRHQVLTFSNYFRICISHLAAVPTQMATVAPEYRDMR